MGSMESSPQIGQNLGGNALSLAMGAKAIAQCAQEMQCSTPARPGARTGRAFSSPHAQPQPANGSQTEPTKPNRLEHASCVPEPTSIVRRQPKFGNSLKNKEGIKTSSTVEHGPCRCLSSRTQAKQLVAITVGL